MDTKIKMQYKRLGKTGLKVSRICLGCMSFGDKKWMGGWVMEKDQAYKIIERAWKAGINFFDTADAYSNGVSEEILGSAIRDLGIPRDEMVIATKLFFPFAKQEPLHDGKKAITKSIPVNNYGLSRKHIFESIEGSLKRLQTDYVDLYQIHRWDYETPIEETMKALHDLVQSGKVRYLGASTMHAWQFAKAQHVAIVNGWTPFSSMQNLYNLVYREEEREVIPMCVDQGVGIIPWSPLHRGYLARPSDKSGSVREKAESSNPRLSSYWVDETSIAAIRDTVKQISDERKVSMAEVALAWVLSKETITSPIVGVSKMEQLEQALSALQLKLTEKELQRLEAPYKPRSILGNHSKL